jgi:hypothetical protein
MKSMKMKISFTLMFAFLLAGSFTSLARGNECKRETSFVDLKPGTYVANVTQTTTALTDGTTVTDNLTMRIKIVSIDEEGKVKAQIIMSNNQRGDVSGNIDSEGKLRLEGFLTHTSLPDKREFKLTAIVKDNTLTKGEYLKTSPRLKSTGVFKVAVLEEKG